MTYSKKIKEILDKNSIEIGNRILIQKDKGSHEGIVMPNTGDPDSIVIKLDSGYNVGIHLDNIKKVRKMEGSEEIGKKPKIVKLKHDPNKPTIAILHTGGTIASRIDYRTGGVTSIFTAEDLVSMVPELAEIANIRCRLLFQMWSEDMESEHWKMLAKEIVEEINEGCDGIIITHGTDYMHCTAAALAFMVQNLPVPVILVGSQRSSDRGSSDSTMNLVCAVDFIANSDFSGVGLCMHANPNDDYCNILPATKTRKLHASRRDAFRPVNSKPIAIVGYKSKGIEFLTGYQKRNLTRKPILNAVFNKKVGLIKTYPGYRSEQLEWYENNSEGIVFEASGMGHLPINSLDDYTKHHPGLLEKLKDMTKKGIPIYIASQCIFGRVNINVYTTGRDLQQAGCKPAYMMPEVAWIKLSWILGHTHDLKEVEELMQKNIAGEIIERSELDEFPDRGLEK